MELMSNLLFSFTNMAAMTSSENYLLHSSCQRHFIAHLIFSYEGLSSKETVVRCRWGISSNFHRKKDSEATIFSILR